MNVMLWLLIALCGAGAAGADALDADLINSPGLQVLRAAAAPAATDAPVFMPADAPVAPTSTEPGEQPELSISTDSLDFEPVAPTGTVIFGVAPRTGAPDAGPVPEGVPFAPSSGEADRIKVRNLEAKEWATRTGYFKFIVDKDSSKMAVFDGTTKVGVFSVSFGSNSSEDGYGSPGTRNTPLGVFICRAGRPSTASFTWFIPYDVPGRSAMGIHGPKESFLGSFLGLIHWTQGCVAMHSRADILTIKAAHAIALKRGTPTRLIIGRGIDFKTIPGW